MIKVEVCPNTLAGQVIKPPEGFIVKGAEGPLEDGE